MKNIIAIFAVLFTVVGCASHNSTANSPTLQLTSNFPAQQVVDCILAHYKGADFYADGVFAADGSIAILLVAPTSARLAVVSDRPGGSNTQYLNPQFVKGNDIPHQALFDRAVNNCQASL